MCFFHSVLSFQQKQKPLGRKVRATGSKRRTSVRHSNRSVGQPAVIAQRATDPSGFVSRPFGRFTDIPFFSDAYKRALRHVFSAWRKARILIYVRASICFLQVQPKAPYAGCASSIQIGFDRLLPEQRMNHASFGESIQRFFPIIPASVL